MSGQFVASTRGAVVIRDGEERPAIHNVPNGYETEFNAVTEGRPAAVQALLKVFAAHSVECDPRNRAVIIRNLRDMRILGDSIAVALDRICAGDASDFAERVFAQSPELAKAVHEETGAVTFAKEQPFHFPFGLTAPSRKSS